MQLCPSSGSLLIRRNQPWPDLCCYIAISPILNWRNTNFQDFKTETSGGFWHIRQLRFVVLKIRFTIVPVPTIFSFHNLLSYCKLASKLCFNLIKFQEPGRVLDIKENSKFNTFKLIKENLNYYYYYYYWKFFNFMWHSAILIRIHFQ